MNRPYHYIEIERRGDVFCTRLCQTQLDELKVHDVAAELRRLISEDACRKLALSLGPQAPECLYSVFLAKLITLQRVVREQKGELVLCNVPDSVHSIFEACGLDQLFRFLPDFDAAVAYWKESSHG